MPFKPSSEDETIARLANGIKRFKLPEEFNFIHLFQALTEKKSTWGEKALGQLAEMFERSPAVRPCGGVLETKHRRVRPRARRHEAGAARSDPQELGTV